MNAEHALAAGQGGTTTLLAPLAQDEVHRQSAAQELAAFLAKSATMLDRCEAMSKAARGDRLGPIYAASRLLNANAQVARALAHVALVERRSRTIIETIQSPAAKNQDLNSGFLSIEEKDNARAKLERRLDRLIEAKEREQERLEDLAIGCCI